ncbi:hypothetical protein MATL_G00097320 [Megalops atlanticus]|uniref:Uncharacterized protein n=1 Tax=Megalops atlanticus TaxID=7932 RepID=A0A9D3Q149_MEGAT|nr:hypothetical protein MATL_G00097320 [Megalops atlanticus]
MYPSACGGSTEAGCVAIFECKGCYSLRVKVRKFQFLPGVIAAEDAGSDQTARADPDHPDCSNPGRGEGDDPERMCFY